MTGSPNGSRFSFLALLMALFLLGYVVWLGDRLTVRTPGLALAGQHPAAGIPAAPASIPAAPASIPAAVGRAGTVPSRPHLAPRCAVLCKIAMGITMGYMLILML